MTDHVRDLGRAILLDITQSMPRDAVILRNIGRLDVVLGTGFGASSGPGTLYDAVAAVSTAAGCRRSPQLLRFGRAYYRGSVHGLPSGWAACWSKVVKFDRGLVSGRRRGSNRIADFPAFQALTDKIVTTLAETGRSDRKSVALAAELGPVADRSNYLARRDLRN